ncbi:MAG: hypothetical protein ACXVZ4_03145, partial [Gaiellaceae bacterium]
PEVKQLRKPSAAAWAVNQLARRHARELDAFLDSASRLREAQLEGGDVPAATKAEREALKRLLQLAGEYAPSTQVDRVRQTLQAAAADEAAAEQVRAGRLERELEPAGFGSLVAGTPKARPKPRDDRAERVAKAQAAEGEARAALAHAEAAEREARQAWERLRDAAERAHECADAAAKALREAKQR